MDKEVYLALRAARAFPDPKTLDEARALVGQPCLFSFAGLIDAAELYDVVTGKIVGVSIDRRAVAEERPLVNQYLCHTEERRQGHDGRGGVVTYGGPAAVPFGHWFCHASDIYLLSKTDTLDIRVLAAREKARKAEENYNRERLLKRVRRLAMSHNRKYYLPYARLDTPEARKKLKRYIGEECGFIHREGANILSPGADHNLISYGRLLGFNFGPIEAGLGIRWLCEALDGYARGHRGNLKTPYVGLKPTGMNTNWWCRPKEGILFRLLPETKSDQLLLPLPGMRVEVL